MALNYGRATLFSILSTMSISQLLPATAKNLIITTPYFLPKIHKPNNPGRPIVSACSCPTALISSYLDKIMAPIVQTLPSYRTANRHLKFFVTLVSSTKTVDITSLYTVIPNDEGLRALKHFFDQQTVGNLALKRYLV